MADSRGGSGSEAGDIFIKGAWEAVWGDPTGEEREGSVAMGPHLGRKKLIVLTFERKPARYGEKVRAKIEPPPKPAPAPPEPSRYSRG